MMKMALLMIAAATLGPSGTAAPARQVAESISYETGGCFGPCPVYSVTVHADGRGLFVGHRYTAVTGRHSFRTTPAEYRAFAAFLEPLHPSSGSVHYDGPPLCDEMATDQSSAVVKWRMRDGREQSFSFYYGCDMDRKWDPKQALAERLRRAPDRLPIAAFIARRR